MTIEKCSVCETAFDDETRGYRFNLLYSGHNDEGQTHTRSICQPVCTKKCLREYITFVAEDL